MKGKFQQSNPNTILQEEKCGNCGYEFYKNEKQKFCKKCFKPLNIVKNDNSIIDKKLLEYIKNFRIEDKDIEIRIKLYELLLSDIKKIDEEKLRSNCKINTKEKERLLFNIGFSKGMAYSNYKIGNKIEDAYNKAFY